MRSWRPQKPRKPKSASPVFVSGSDRTVSLHGAVEFGKNVVIGDYVVLGYPKEARIEEARHGMLGSTSGLVMNIVPTSIGEATYIGSHVVVGEGTRISNEVCVEDFCRLGFDCLVGDHTRIMYGAFVCDRVTIGSYAKVAGFVCDAAVIGDGATVMGQLVYEYTQPHVAWGIDEPAPRIESRSVVAFGAVVVGGIVIGENSYIAAGAIVTKDVPPRSVVTGTNGITPANEWKGEKLAQEFWTWQQEKGTHSA